MLARMVNPKKQKKVSDGSGFPAHGVKPDSRRDRLREMFFTVQASGYPAALLCCLLLTFALAAAQSPEGRYVSCVESQISASKSAKRPQKNEHSSAKLPLSLPCVYTVALHSRSLSN